MPIVVLLVGWWISSSIDDLGKSVDKLRVEVRELNNKDGEL